jgi:hypothetical protein
MKKIILLFGCFLVLTGAIVAQTTFIYTGSTQTYTVPAGIFSISIDARGAQGGGSYGGAGGLGARMTGNYSVTPGQVLTIVVGQQGLLQVGGNAQNSSGGGGGTFVYDASGPTLLVAAGGGGGKCNYTGSSPLHPAAAGQISTSGGASSDGNPGGTGGNGGPAGLWSGIPCAGGGTGWLSNGGGPYGGFMAPSWAGGTGFCGGGGGGCGGVGGYGGGGGGGNHYGGGGGGGGYSGGGGGTDPTHGGGGGSYSIGTAQINTAGYQTGDGVVIISDGSPPCMGDVTPPTFVAGAGGPDQQALTNNVYMASFGQADLAQSFIPAASDICGASIYMQNTGPYTGDVTIELWDNLPTMAGTMLATGTVTNVSTDTWADVTWSSVPITPGNTYYLVFTGTNTSMGISGDLNNGYPYGMVYANGGFGAFPSYDYTFKTASCGGAACPTDIILNASAGTCGAVASFSTPSATDDCIGFPPTVSQVTGLSSGSTFPLGTNAVAFQATDGSGNTAICSFNVIVNDVTAPVANVPNINISLPCGLTVTPPTATDNCLGMVIGTTPDPTSFSTNGTYIIHWTYNDTHGNTSTQTQTVTINDVSSPVPDLININVVISCGDTVNAPTATDNCDGTVTGVTGDPTIFPTEGSFTINWSYTDANGNNTVQTQNVTVSDSTDPVPNAASLPPLSGCSVTIGNPPGATDNCEGAIIGTTTDPLMYSVVGVYSITWNYNDGNGNISTQTQSVTVIDCSGIENENELTANIYPNPSNGIFTLSLSELPTGNTTIRIMDAIGQVLYTNVLTAQTMYYDFSYLSPGIYYVQVVNGNRSFTRPIIITQKY